MKNESDTHYVSAFFFDKHDQVAKHTLRYYKEVEAHTMFQRIVNKYKVGQEKVLVALRKVSHELIKSEKLPY